MPSDIVFYTNPRSRGRIARWMLEEIGVNYETRILEYGEDMGSEEFRAINPMAKVPVLVHDGRVITETAAICAYLADAFPDAGLKPEIQYLGSYYRWLFFASGPFEAAISDYMLGHTVPERLERSVGYGNFDRAMVGMVSAIGASEYIAGPTFSAADVYVGSHLQYSLASGAIPQKDALVRYVTHVTDRPAFRRVNEIDGPSDPASDPPV